MKFFEVILQYSNINLYNQRFVAQPIYVRRGKEKPKPPLGGHYWNGLSKCAITNYYYVVVNAEFKKNAHKCKVHCHVKHMCIVSYYTAHHSFYKKVLKLFLCSEKSNNCYFIFFSLNSSWNSCYKGHCPHMQFWSANKWLI